MLAMQSSSPFLFANLTWSEVAKKKLNPRFVLMFPIGATEAHGPHCPLATDVIISVGSCLAAAEELHRRGFEAYVLPPLAYTHAQAARDFPGNISISEATERQLLYDICKQLVDQGMPRVCMVNNHGEPGNVRAIYDTLDRVREELGVKLLFPNRARKEHAQRMTPAYKLGSTHADRYETSLIMRIAPALVREELRVLLPAIPLSLPEKMFREKLDNFKDMGMREAYCGDPAAASADEGRETLAILSTILVDSIEQWFAGREPDHSRGLFGTHTD